MRVSLTESYRYVAVRHNNITMQVASGRARARESSSVIGHCSGGGGRFQIVYSTLICIVQCCKSKL
jgi:hypothetical protein